MQGQTTTTTTQVVVDVTDATFERLVVEESRKRPVIVDLWAEWCGPCKTLGPILEKVANEHDGEFLLAKLDVDANPATAAAFGVQSIPTVVAFKDGRPATGFVGAYPEAEVKRFVDELLPSDPEKDASEGLAEEADGDVEGAEAKYRETLAADPDNETARLGLARILVDCGELAEARDLAGPLLPDPAAEAILSAARVAEWGDLTERGTLASAKRLAAKSRYRQALDEMLGALRDDPSAREAMLDLFAVLGDDDGLTREYRGKLANALF